MCRNNELRIYRATLALNYLFYLLYSQQYFIENTYILLSIRFLLYIREKKNEKIKKLKLLYSRK